MLFDKLSRALSSGQASREICKALGISESVVYRFKRMLLDKGILLTKGRLLSPEEILHIQSQAEQHAEERMALAKVAAEAKKEANRLLAEARQAQRLLGSSMVMQSLLDSAARAGKMAPEQLELLAKKSGGAYGDKLAQQAAADSTRAVIRDIQIAAKEAVQESDAAIDKLMVLVGSTPPQSSRRYAPGHGPKLRKRGGEAPATLPATLLATSAATESVPTGVSTGVSTTVSTTVSTAVSTAVSTPVFPSVQLALPVSKSPERQVFKPLVSQIIHSGQVTLTAALLSSGMAVSAAPSPPGHDHLMLTPAVTIALSTAADPAALVPTEADPTAAQPGIHQPGIPQPAAADASTPRNHPTSVQQTMSLLDEADPAKPSARSALDKQLANLAKAKAVRDRLAAETAALKAANGSSTKAANGSSTKAAEVVKPVVAFDGQFKPPFGWLQPPWFEAYPG